MDSSGLKIFYESILEDATPNAIILALQGDLEIRKAHTFTWPLLTGQESICWAELDGEPVGCQVWSKKQNGRVWWYEVSYVLPAHRGKGVLPEIRQWVRKLAKEDGRVRFLESLVAIDNEAMLKSMEKVGYKPANYHFRFSVDQTS